MFANRLAVFLCVLGLSSYASGCSNETPADDRDDALEENEESATGEDEDDETDTSEEDEEDDDKPASNPDAGPKRDATVAPMSDGSTRDTGTPPSGDGGPAKDSGKPSGDSGTAPTGDGECCDDGDCICRGGAPTEASIRESGPYEVASYASGFAPPMMYAGATIYYPMDADAPFSAIVMCPGWTAVQSAIADYGTFFASHGIVTMIIDTLTVLDFVPERAPQVLEALTALKGENEREGSPLKGKLTADRYGLGGWSMGGGATWIATGDHPELKSGFTIAGHHATAGGASAVATKIRVPTLMLAAENDDDVIPLGGANQSQDAYNTIPDETPKLMYEMAGLDHFGINSPLMNKDAAHFSLAFEKTFLDGDTRYRQFLLTKPSNATDWMSNIE